MRPRAEKLFENEWLQSHCGLNKDLRPQDSIPFLRKVSTELQKNDVARHLIGNLELDSPAPQYAFDGDVAMLLSSSPGHRSFTGIANRNTSPSRSLATTSLKYAKIPFVKTTFNKPVNCL